MFVEFPAHCFSSYKLGEGGGCVRLVVVWMIEILHDLVSQNARNSGGNYSVCTCVLISMCIRWLKRSLGTPSLRNMIFLAGCAQGGQGDTL